MSDLLTNLNFSSILPALAFLAALGLFTFFLIKPFECMLVLLFTRPLLGPTRSIEMAIGPLKINLLGGYSIAVILLGSFFLLLNKDKQKLPGGITGSFACFLSLCVVSLSYTMNFSNAVGDIFRYLSAFVFLTLMFELVDTKEKYSLVLKLIILSACIPIGLGLIQFITKTGLFIDTTTGTSRVRSFFLLPNPYAQYLVLVIIACAYAVKLPYRTVQKIMFSVIALTAAYSLYLTWTKTSWIAFGAAMVLYAVFDKRRFIYLPIMVLGLLSLVVFTSVGGHLVTESLAKKQYGMSSWQWRNLTWKVLLNGFLQKPVLGWGLGSSMDLLMLLRRDPHVPHNDYIRLLVELGLFGFTAFFSFMFVVATKFLRFFTVQDDFLRQGNRMCLTLIAVWLVHMYGDNTLNDVTTLMYIFTLLGATMRLNVLHAATRARADEDGRIVAQTGVIGRNVPLLDSREIKLA
jgi:O-antigen ligase